MADKVCTRFIDDDGLDVGCHLISKEYILENYPDIVPWMKAPAFWVWGSGISGQLGNNTGGSASSPVQTISSGTNWKQISGGASVAASIKTDGTLWLWGLNTVGSLGDGTAINKSSPVQTISGGTNWKQISAGCVTGAIKTDGTLWTWGFGTSGQLGDNTIVSKSSPVQTIAAGNNWSKVSAGNTLMGAIKTDGTLWTWGGPAGRIGDNTSVTKSSPVQIAGGGNNWKQVSVGSASAAVKTDGTLWAWGYNGFGQIGNNTRIAGNVSSPVQEFSAGTNWKQVSSGGSVISAIKTDGTLWLWGNGYEKFDGTGVDVDRSTPFQISSGGTNWKEVQLSSLGSTIGAIKTDGTLWLWGDGTDGMHGNNSTIRRSSPVQTISGGTDWKSVSLASFTTLALRDEGDF